MAIRFKKDSPELVVVGKQQQEEKEPITYRKLMDEALLGAYESLKGLAEISTDFSNEPRDRIAAYKGRIEFYIKLAHLAEIESENLAALPVLQAISNNGSSK